MTPDLIRKYAAPVPRYTSYPTAPYFNAEVGPERYRQWLQSVAPDSALSLYVHVPFCQKLCWYCGCNTKAVQRYTPVAEYLRCLTAEISNVAGELPRRHVVRHVHWGGGSPSLLEPNDAARLAEAVRAYFTLASDVEFAVEIDPRDISLERVSALARSGVTRVSFGVQDFDIAVQRAINREQSFELTQRAVEAFRDKGVRSVNIDLVYGLPHQTMDSLERTLDLVLELAPDRIAAFGYAHLPARLKHQRLIDETVLPDAAMRTQLAARLARRLTDAGYVQIGLDHFARPGDALADAAVRRNFQGYTTDTCETLVGLGASAIGKLPQGFVQNAVATGEYKRAIRETGFATAKGIELSMDDRVRGFVIEQLMCSLEYSRTALESAFGPAAAEVSTQAEALLHNDEDALLEPTSTGFRVTERGRPFIRTIASRFDAYLGRSAARHSTGV
ncbi:MAG: oxygen-independent coproporphyrinogen III oxidase [Hyphomicrobiaceae bacterium]